MRPRKLTGRTHQAHLVANQHPPTTPQRKLDALSLQNGLGKHEQDHKKSVNSVHGRHLAPYKSIHPPCSGPAAHTQHNVPHLKGHQLLLQLLGQRAVAIAVIWVAVCSLQSKKGFE